LVQAGQHLQKGLTLYFQLLHQRVVVVAAQETRLIMLVELVALVVEPAIHLVVLETHILAEQEMKVDIHPQKGTTEAVMLPILRVVWLEVEAGLMRLVLQILQVLLVVLEVLVRPHPLQAHL
jgi:hypothetical protein